MEKQKPILSVDFDGVLHSYTSGWQGVDVISDEPVPGAREFIRLALKHFRVAIFSSRSNYQSGVMAMQEWMKKHGFPVDECEFPRLKPSAFLTLDDRAMQFTGYFPLPELLLNFVPWNKRESDAVRTVERPAKKPSGFNPATRTARNT